MPKLKISPIHRQAASGTTFVFTQHLSAINDAWKRGPGRGMTVVWPAGTAARGSDDMVALIQKEPGSIGYLGYGHAEKSKLPMAWLQNKSGEYVKPSLESGQATLNSAPLPENLRGWVPDPEGKDSYPIVTYTWLLVRKHDGNSRTTAALKDVLKYCLTDGQNDSVASATFPCRKRCGKPSFMQWMQSLHESSFHAQDPARSTCAPVTWTGTSFACGSLADAARVIGIGHAAVPALCLTVAVRPQSDMPKEPLMLPIHTILHPTDFSARAEALRFGLRAGARL